MTAPSFAPDIPTSIERIDELRPFIAEKAAEGERQHGVLPGVIDELAKIGTFRASLHERYDGLPAGVGDRLAIARAVARGDGGAGWVTAIILGNNWILGLFPREAQDEVFGANPDARVSAVIAINGRADKVDGGYHVSGKWGYNSGLAYTSWVLVAAALYDENGEFVDTAQLLVPRGDVSEEDTWFVAGLKSTGSNTVVAEDVFVPSHRVLRHSTTVGGDNADDDEPGFRAAFVAALSIWLVGPQLGIAEAAFDRVVEKANTKDIAYTAFKTQAESTAVQLRIAKARLGIDAALLFAQDAANRLDRHAAAGTFPDYTTRAHVRAATGWISETLQDALDSLLTVHGAGAFAEVNPLQRYWRDLGTAGRHALILPDVGYELLGRALLGQPGEAVTPLV